MGRRHKKATLVEGGKTVGSAWLSKEYEDTQNALEGEMKNGSWGTGKGYVTHSQESYKPCTHYGDEKIFEIDKKEVYGAREGDIIVWGADLIIAMVMLNVPGDKKFILSGPDEFVKLNESLMKTPPIVRLDWSDFKTPAPAGMKFWKGLWHLMPKGKTILTCMGGHGRTGTCAGALLVANGWKADDAIKHIRKEYCDKAIDNSAQKSYLAELEAGWWD